MGVMPGLRTHLKISTGSIHTLLDRRLMPIAMQPDIRPFLAIQYQARLPIEIWLEGVMASPPPRQTPLLAEDLDNLGVAAECLHTDWDGDPREATGLAWLLAGSCLGNRVIAARRTKLGLDNHTRFLCDPAMGRFWRELAGDLRRPADEARTAHAVTGARRGFAHFLECLDKPCEAIAA